MAQSSILDASGLERDCRQDELPTRQDEFPTRQDEFPTVYSHNGQTLHHEDPRVISEINSDLPLHRPATTKAPRLLCGLRKSTFWLVALLLVLLVFTGVGAGVLGSRMRNPEPKSPSLSSTAFPFSTITSPATSSLATSSSAISSPATSFSATSSSATSSPTSSSSSTKFPVVKQLVKPENDCEAIGPQYTIRIRTFRGDTVNTQFNVSCNTQFDSGDFMSFYSPSLTTCMHGCAMFNYWQKVYNNHLELNCSGVTYLPGSYQEGNCWLKPWGYTTVVTQQQNSSYARLNHVI